MDIHIFNRAIETWRAAGRAAGAFAAVHRRSLRAEGRWSNADRRPRTGAALGEEYPRLCEEFRDSDGRPPRHTFFYPIEMYDETELDALAGPCRLGLCEVEIHLHHDGDTSENLKRTLLTFKEVLAVRHGLLARHRETRALAYGFVHGVWALDNSRPEGAAAA